MAVLFNATYYLENNRDVLTAWTTNTSISSSFTLAQWAEYHFNNWGWKELRNPSSDFDVAYYITRNTDVFNAAINPYTHFLQFGAAEGRAPNSSLEGVSATFDEARYLTDHPDVQTAGFDAYAHWVLYGSAEGRAAFDTSGNTITGTGTGTPGETFALTTGVDTFTGTANNDTFVASDTTFTTGDSLNGGAGTDSLNVTFVDDTVTPIVDLVSIENVSLRNADATPVALALDASGWKGVQTITAERPAGNVTVTGVAALATLAVNGGGGTGKGFTVEFANSVVSGTSDTLTVNLSSADAGTVDASDGAADGFETVNVVVAGDNTLDDITSPDLANLAISGSGSLELTASTLALDSLTSTATDSVVIDALTLNKDGVVTLGAGDDELTAVTLDATTATATIALGAGNDAVSVAGLVDGDAVSIDGGAGNDAIEVDDLTDSVTIAGGDGTDTLRVATAIAAALDEDATLSGIETLAITNALANSLDLSDFGANRLSLEVGAASAGTITMASGNTIAYDEAAVVGANVTSGAIIAAVAGASDFGSDDDVVNIEVNADFDGAGADVFTADVSVDFVETVNITVTDPDTTTAGGGENVVVSLEDGDRIETITVKAAVATSVVEDTTNFTAVNKFTAEGSTAGVTVDLTNATQGVSMTGGDGDDDFTGTAFADQILGGKGDDVLAAADGNDVVNGGEGDDDITGGLGANTLTGGAGVDNFNFADGDSTSTSLTTITDFAAGADGDTLTFGAASTYEAISDANQTAISADTTLGDALTQAASQLLANEVTAFTFGGATYVLFEDGTNAGAYNAAEDVVIKLTGVSVDDLDAANFL